MAAPLGTALGNCKELETRVPPINICFLVSDSCRETVNFVQQLPILCSVGQDRANHRK